MPREKKYTKTIAFRITAEEWELIEQDMVHKNCAKPSTWVRGELAPVFDVIRMVNAEEAKKAAARAKRAEAATKRLKESRGQ